MARLLGTNSQDVQEDRISAAQHAATEWNAVVVLKGAYTVVAAPDGRINLIPFANPALATAGTGDVLAGTIAGLLAQLHAQSIKTENSDSLSNLYNAATAGAYVHALAGEIAAREVGSVGVVAGDLLTRLPEAIQELR
jgi:NAD(P)H-hydrate epimerase